MIIPQKMTAKLSNFEQLNDRYGWYRFDLEHPARLHNEAGQYMMIAVGEGKMRAYSMCDRPDVDTSFEIILDNAPNGLGVNYIRSLQFGDQIHCLGPLGKLTIDPAHGTGPIYLLATGSGVSPFLAMITDQLQIKTSGRPITLIWNVSYAHEFFWLTQLQNLQQNFPNFRFIPVVSRPDDNWKLATGYVADILAKEDLSLDAHYYLCGSPAMIDSTIKYLQTNRAVSPDQITLEQFFAPASS